MTVVFGALLPHPPILIPAIGRERLKEAKQSCRALEEISRRLKQKNFDTLVVITPHGSVGQASVPVYTGHVFEGNFSAFGLPKPNYVFKGDPALALALVKNTSLASACAETILDHGVLVPLYYPLAVGLKKPLLPIAVAFAPLNKLFQFGQQLAKTALCLKRRIAVIASADMSHCLAPGAPGGYSPQGKEFDERLVALVKNNDVQGILDFDPVLADAAGQDALWSLAILLGVLDSLPVETEVLSYEGPFGVGYMVAAFKIKGE